MLGKKKKPFSSLHFSYLRNISLQEESKHFIDVENIEGEIEKALDCKVKFNFAIDLEGNKYFKLPDEPTDETEQIFEDMEHSTNSPEKTVELK